MDKTNIERPYKQAVLRDRDGNLDLEWYIEFYAYDEATDQLKRKRVKIPLSYKTEASRRKYAAKMIAEYNQLLESGYFFPKDPEPYQPYLGSGEFMLLESLYTMIDDSAYLRPKSRGTYRSAINKLSELMEKDIPFCSLTSSDVYRIRDRFLRAGNAASTANKSIDHIARVYRKFAKRNKIEHDPFKDIERLPETEVSTANIAFSSTDQKIIEDYLLENDYPLYVFTRFMYYAFIRPKELRQLKVRHVRKSLGIITIPGEIAKNRKTENVPIVPPLRPFINFHEYPDQHYLFGKDLSCNKINCGENTPYNRHAAALKACGLNGMDYTLYSWKHTGAVNAYLSGVGIRQLQTMLRHKSLEETDIYLKSLGLRIDPNLESYNW